MSLKLNKEYLEIIPGYMLNDEIHRSQKHVLYKATRKTDNLDVVIKTFNSEFLKKDDLLKIRREYEIITQFEDDHIIKCHDLIQYGNANVGLVLEDFGISLSNYQKQHSQDVYSINDFLSIATDLVNTINVVHSYGIVHNNIETSNFLIHPKTKKIKLIDFDQSSALSQEYLESSSLKNWAIKSLPYLSPEQTGRINRGVDYRSDFYALGAVFYKLLTGQYLFEANDNLEWVYHIISKEPKAPNLINKNIPEVLSKIILKLVSKNAENRYQSNYGLLIDLQKCKEQIKIHGNDFYFDIAQSDISQKFKVPQKLYGREKEIKKLESHLQNASLGSVEFCLVSGYSGVGKTAIVKELGRSIASKNGFLIEGKFDQFKQNAPYTTIISALGNLIKLLLGEPINRLKAWKKRILNALGSNGQLIIDYIPELELIIGQQESVLNLPIEESHNRFLTCLINFINVFGSENYPLVIFLDDLQWSDIPTLNLIKQLVLSEELNYVFLIGAYRNNEVDATHPLDLTLREIERQRFVDNLVLNPLNKSATSSLVKDTLLCNLILAKELTQKVYEKTHGNPFFLIELLKNLKDKGVIYFDLDKGYWNCNINALNKEKYSDNVIDILVSRQLELGATTQKALQLAACIGSTFDLNTLSIIQEDSFEETGACLYEALLQNMITPLDDNYKFFEDYKSKKNINISSSKTINPVYKFQHDRVQQAAYSQIPENKKETIHLSIGRLLLKNSKEVNQDEKFLDIINHLNIGRQLITEQENRIHIAKLNLEAGRKAKESSAYSSALDYLKIGREMLGKMSWQINYQLTWELHNELQYSYYLTGDWENADKLTNTLLEKSKTPIEKGLVLSSRTRQYSTTQRMKESIKAAYDGLLILGFNFNDNPSTKDVDKEVELVKKHLNNREVSDLIHLPEIKDQKAQIASQLIMEIFPAAFLSGSGEMFPYLVLKSVNIGLQYGNSPETAFSYAAYGMLLCGHFNDTAQGYEYGKLGVKLIEKLDNVPLRARIMYVYAMFVHHWNNHWSTMTPWFRKGIEAGYQSGDLLYLAYSAQDCIIWDPSLDLETSSTEHKKLLEIVRECEYKDSLDSGTLFLQMQLNFMGLTVGKFSLTDENYDEDECLKGMHQRHFMTGICNYHLYKAEIYLLYNDPEGALPHIIKLEENISSFMALPQATRFQIVAFLVRAMLINLNPKKNKGQCLLKMIENRDIVSKWANQCPENFMHLLRLMEAELANISGNIDTAITLYESSIKLSKDNNYRRDEAMANEFTGKFFLKNNLVKAAEGYLKESQFLYYRWGAARKVNEMTKSYGIYTNNSRDSTKKLFSNDNTDQDTSLDFSSILKASQSISGELILDKLLLSTLTILMENAGAQRGFLLLEKENKIQLVKYRDGTKTELKISNNLKDNEGIPVLPLTLINNALRTQKPIVIDNASGIHTFSSDPYLKKKKPLSILCIPLPKHGKWPMAIYLENNIISGAFTEERVKVINLLASQASISMENARIYEQQKSLLKAQERFVPGEFLKHLGHESITNVKLGESVSMEMNVLFSDILNFTPLVEKLSPKAVIQFLNRLFNEMGIVIKGMGGFIDSYQGDQIMALFPTSSFKAVKAAIEMTRALSNFNDSSKNENIPPISIGVGINTGPLVLGTMGALNRMQCSVLGDTVNLASRIESLTRLYGAKLLISEHTYKTIEDKDYFTLRMVDYVAVKGKDTAVKLYEVIDAENETNRELKKKTMTLVSQGMDLYFSRDFKNAKTIFLNAREIDPTDNVVNLFLNRIKTYLKNPPDKSWRGYESLKHK
ncbi:AAA family ATPase [Winogradskyella sp. A3E31]|uniref:AAA family ATPase n=1 Tax=Winogradskyella sp. A3E31 TaxID=3349637 RepID=UPI00398B3766